MLKIYKKVQYNYYWLKYDQKKLLDIEMELVPANYWITARNQFEEE